MSDTPITDATTHNVGELAMLARRFERESGRLKESLAVCRNALFIEHEAGIGDHSYAIDEADALLHKEDRK